LGAILQYLFGFSYADPFDYMPPQRWGDRRRFKLHRHTPGQRTHRNRLFGLLLCLDAERYDNRMGAIVEHLFVFGQPDPIGYLSPQRWHDRRRFQLLGHQAGCNANCRRLLIVLLCMDPE